MGDKVNTLFCKDCRFALRGFLSIGYRFAICSASPRELARDLVTGKAKGRQFYYCSTERKGFMPNDCGPEGKKFEPKVGEKR